MNLEQLEQSVHELLDIEIYSAADILKAEGCTDADKNMAIAYQIAINRAKKIISVCIKREIKDE